MPFVEPISTKQAIDNIISKKYLLPPTKKEIVWHDYEVERLFDSLLRGMPIGLFTFWQAKLGDTNKKQFYEFVNEKDEQRNTYHRNAIKDPTPAFSVFLDGQQRLTYLYVGLKGSYGHIMPRNDIDNNMIQQNRRLYLNLVSLSKGGDIKYDFRFLTEEEGKRIDNDHVWFFVRDILILKNPVDINNYLYKRGLSIYKELKSEFATKTLYKFWENIHKNKLITLREIYGDLDEILNQYGQT